MREYVDFLGSQSPYDQLDASDLEALAQLVEAEYFTAGTIIITAGEPPLSHFYVVRSGEVEVVDRGRVIDVLGAGETFGQISVLSGLAPPLSIRAANDTLCYRFCDPRPHLRHPERLQFSHYGSLVTRERLTRAGLVDQALRLARHQMRPIVWCAPDVTVSAAASAMTDAGQSCALIQRGDQFGIVTDSDFRAGLATGTLTTHEPVAGLASFPAATIGADTLVGDAFLRMVESGYHHLVVTGPGEKPIGILRVVDLASAEVRNPLVIRRAVDDAANLNDLAAAAALLPSTWLELYDTGVSVMHIAALLSAVIDAVMLRLIDLTDIGEDAVPNRTSWLLLGSVARREPLPRSDVDTALVWDDHPDAAPAGKLQQWAGRVLDNMERCGLSRCAEGANATNPLFARSKSAFIDTATSWITNPTQTKALLLSSIIADSRPITDVPLGRAVSDAMLTTTRSRDYLSRLLRFTISVRPPVGFVFDFVVEHSGSHRGHLDLKAGGLVPIASLGRWIAIVTGDDRGSTITRLRRGHAAGLLTGDETDTLVRAFEYIYELVLDNEIAAIRNSSTASPGLPPKSSTRSLAATYGSPSAPWQALPALQGKAADNGYTQCEIVDAAEVYRQAPHLGDGALGGLTVPDESIICTWTTNLALATDAVARGVDLHTATHVTGVSVGADRTTVHTSRGDLTTGWVVNAAGLGADYLDQEFGYDRFHVTPRRGELLVYDKLARALIDKIVLPVPTARGKGVLVSPTIYGNVMLGPTAEDLQDRTATATSEAGLAFLLEKGRRLMPRLLEEEVTATYSGLRAATDHGDYLIECDARQRYVLVGGIRSTGLTSGMAVAERIESLLQQADELGERRTDLPAPPRMPNIGEAYLRPYQDPQCIAADPAYGTVVCFCERVTAGEIRDAYTSLIPPAGLDGLRRRTRAMNGRCQGFFCGAEVNALMHRHRQSPRPSAFAITPTENVG